MLSNFHFLHHFSKGGTISGTILADNTNLLGSLGLFVSKHEINLNITSTNTFKLDWGIDAIQFMV